MKLTIIHSRSGGHVELKTNEKDVTVDTIIARIEEEMNHPEAKDRLSVLAETEPGEGAHRVADYEDLRRHPDATVWVIPQLVGG